MNLKTIIVYTILSIIINHLGVQCKELNDYLSFNTKDIVSITNRKNDLITAIRSLKNAYIRLLILSSRWRIDDPSFTYFRNTLISIELNSSLNDLNIFEKTFLERYILKDGDQQIKNLEICKKTFELVCKQPDNLYDKFIDEIQRDIIASLRNEGNENTPTYSISMGFGNIMPLMNEKDFMDYITGKHDNQKFFLNEIMEKSLPNIFSAMNHILYKLPFKELSFEQFSNLRTKITDNAEILLIYKSMLKDVINVTTLVLKILMYQEMLKMSSDKHNGRAVFYLHEEYRTFIHYTIVKWNYMCSECVTDNHKPNLKNPNIIKFNLKGQFIEIVKNRQHGETTEDFKIKSSMYGYYLLDTSDDIYNSFINDNDILTDKRKLLDIKLWLITMKRDAEALFFNGYDSIDVLKTLSDYMKIRDYISKLESIGNSLKFMKV